MTVKESLEGMVAQFDPKKAKGLDVTIQHNTTGEGGGNYNVAITETGAVLNEGQADNPSATLEMAADDWIAISQGQLDPTMAFMTGKLRVSGDLGLLMRFQSIFGQ